MNLIAGINTTGMKARTNTPVGKGSGGANTLVLLSGVGKLTGEHYLVIHNPFGTEILRQATTFDRSEIRGDNSKVNKSIQIVKKYNDEANKLSEKYYNDLGSIVNKAKKELESL